MFFRIAVHLGIKKMYGRSKNYMKNVTPGGYRVPKFVPTKQSFRIEVCVDKKNLDYSISDTTLV